MNFFNNVHETQILRTARRPKPSHRPVPPLHRSLFPLQSRQREIARAAVIEVLG